ncbi:MAG: hypothetical protein A3I11_03705 [Elusimicrobia bacterium RIFCSPLOWO2_02_FULL_39_32]|nr:MAG: hypothetical protein A3B80_02275 [Elusimicrobia bacterium RIFCSPHIGHO2_02_FULL_39_36]OGR92813.1 MAG: hypothetical protein A3I11_03705 [Elusimicrobia bacterium RIFCSPLOWO2_02_FULL_39_32]OGR99597.1 MAG: hypothetical protein A3G85_01060 [Elusimicrobia bacterium RIFCSPLOWO2_12_FULL_39_28]
MDKRDKTSILLLICLPIFFLSGTLTSSHTFFMRDITYLFHPWRSLSAQMIQSGLMPLWNPYEMGGMPFLANCQSAILYPFTILFWIFHFVIGLKCFHFLHYALASLGFFLFAKKCGFSKIISFSGSVLFAYNGYSLTRHEFLSVLGSLIWLPWLLIFCIQKISKKNLTQLFFCSLVLTFSFFSGFPQILVLQIIFAFLFSFIFTSFKSNIALDNGKFGFKQNILDWIKILILFIFMSAPQWMPTLELLQNSIRGGPGISFSEAVTYSFPLDSLFGLIYPFRILHHSDRFTGEKFFWIWSAWWGFTASFLILFSLISKYKKLIALVVSLSAIGILWSMGEYCPFFEFFYAKISFLHLFRYPPVALYLTTSSIALLMLVGFHSIQTAKLNKNFKKLILLLLTLALSLELWFYSKNITPTIIPEYYQVTFNAIKSVLKDRPGTVLLSHKVNSQRRLAGMSSQDAQMRFRAYLFDLTNLPYRIKTINPSGEPLALNSFQELYQALASSVSIEEAKPLINFWNITHFLTEDFLGSDWKLIGQEKDLKIYRNLEALGSAFSLENKENLPISKNQKKLEFSSPSFIKIYNHKIISQFILETAKLVIFTMPYYPGWELYCATCDSKPNKKIPTFMFRNYFTGSHLTDGDHLLYLVYQPVSWKIGMILFIFTILILTLFFMRIHLKCLTHQLRY